MHPAVEPAEPPRDASRAAGLALQAGRRVGTGGPCPQVQASRGAHGSQSTGLCACCSRSALENATGQDRQLGGCVPQRWEQTHAVQGHARAGRQAGTVGGGGGCTAKLTGALLVNERVAVLVLLLLLSRARHGCRGAQRWKGLRRGRPCGCGGGGGRGHAVPTSLRTSRTAWWRYTWLWTHSLVLSAPSEQPLASPAAGGAE